jgi:ER degradation enhancer, mannosidase alpha-like 2
MRRAFSALALLFVAAAASAADPVLAERVRKEFLDSWHAYETYAWGHDELKPLSKTHHDWYGQSLLITPVDTLPSLILLGFPDEAEKAKKLIVETLSFDKDVNVKNFEVTIRLLGGLIAAYELTGDARLLALADDLGTRLMPVFESPTGMPYMFVNLKTGKVSGPRTNPAEIGTLVLEFGRLAELTKKKAYFTKPMRALEELYKRRGKTGLVGEWINVETGEWVETTSHVGGAIDSYYEYLLKCDLLFAHKPCREMWKTSIRALNTHVADEEHTGFWYGEVDMQTGKRTAKHYGALHAFMPGLLVLAGDVRRAKKLQDSAFRMWTLHGIEPEVLDYREMKVVHAGYPLRPEIIESAFYLYRATKDRKYLDQGRTFLESLITHCRTDAGYTTLKSVVTKEKGDLMPSYFLAETLKYLYLLFAPESELDLKKVVFNTEAHPLKRR